MRQFQGSAPAYLYPGRQPLRYCSFGGADEGAGLRGPVVLLQIHRQYQAAPSRVMRSAPLKVHAAMAGRGKNITLNINVHGISDVLNPFGPGLRPVAFMGSRLQINFGKNQVKTGGRTGGSVFYLLPVIHVLGKLVAGDNRPF